jgi:hypothetical protein
VDSAPATGGIAWLARRRVMLGFVFGAIVFAAARPTPATLAVGGAIACVGEALRVWAAGHLNKSREVTTSGPYRWLAHPLYVGSGIMGAGLAIASGSAYVALLIATYLALTIGAAVKSEEAFLRHTFGTKYEQYRGGIAEPAASHATRRFSLARARANREYRAAIGLIVAVLLLFLKATYNGTFWREGG